MILLFDNVFGLNFCRLGFEHVKYVAAFDESEYALIVNRDTWKAEIGGIQYLTKEQYVS